MFDHLHQILDRAIKVNIDDIMFNILKQEDDVIELIIELNTEEQLFQGVDGKGRELADIGGTYAPITVAIKRTENQPFDRVTLKDTGDFYKSFYVVPLKDGFEIVADTIKDGQNLEDRWGNEIIGLNELSIEQLQAFLVPLVIEYWIDYVLEG